MQIPQPPLPIGRTDDEIFEDEVRRIARALWPSAEFQGASLLMGRERDGVFVTEECIHLIEATTSSRKYKAENDGKKLHELATELSRSAGDKVINCYFITKFEATAEQRESLKHFKSKIHSLSFSQFQQKLINAADYLTVRDQYAFGSARDPENDSVTPSSGYIPLDVLELNSREPWNPDQIKNSLRVGARIHLLGDFGAGKSMTLREVYQLLRKDYFRNNTEKFPIYINLRDHQGQANPAEVFMRHAANLGFKHPEHLVRAWRAGYGLVILDGFDEIGTLGWSGQWKKLQVLRYRSMELIRKFVEETPSMAGIIVAGRAHFFDSDTERRNALGLKNEKLVELSLNDFSEAQIEAYLSKFGISSSNIPSWLPRRPLLLGYLAARKLIGDIVNSSDGQNDPAVGWEVLLDRITAREARIEAGIDGLTLRRVIERLATKTRLTQSGLGPITQADLADAFQEVCGYAPDDPAMVLLQRLPGLGTNPGSEGTRSFIHEDFADACRAGDVFRFTIDPYTHPLQPLENLERICGDIAQYILAKKFTETAISKGKIEAALKVLELREKCAVLIADIVLTSFKMGMSFNRPVYVKSVAIDTMDISEIDADFAKIEFQECLFSELQIPSENGSKLPRFMDCVIGHLFGRVSIADLPQGVFDSKCTIERFEEAATTTRHIMQLSLPLGNKVLLSLLKKLFLQKGSGRRENALYRGLDERARRLVPEVLHALKAAGLVEGVKHADNRVWYPVRSEMKRAFVMLNSPSACMDPLIKETAEYRS